MKDKLNALKEYVKSDPITSATVVAVAIGTALGAADKIASINSKRTYSKIMKRSLKNSK